MKSAGFTFVAMLALVACSHNDKQPLQTSARFQGKDQARKTESLSEARKGFTTRLIRRESAKRPVPEPPPGLFRIIQYDSAAGKLAAYLTLDPKNGKRHPAIIWVTGGDYNTIGNVWKDAPASNDQTASAFRKAGIVLMFPSLRGGNDNPGVREGFFGEVDDVLAAADYLAQQPFVDPTRIYLGGHSTGGTLAMLVAESSARFRAVFSFGPVYDVRAYGDEMLPFNVADRRELELRAPIRWLTSVKGPLFVFEGDQPPGNLDSWRAMSRVSTSLTTHFFRVPGANHFSVLAPVSQLIAAKIIRDDGPSTNLAFTEEELQNLVAH